MRGFTKDVGAHSHPHHRYFSIERNPCYFTFMNSNFDYILERESVILFKIIIIMPSRVY